MIRVLVIDDHPVFRKGLCDIIDASEECRVIFRCGNGAEALKYIEKMPGSCDVATVDISLPDISGLELVGKLSAVSPDLRSIVISMYPHEQFAQRAVRSGAWAYLSKEDSGDRMIEIIVAVSKSRYGTHLQQASIKPNFCNVHDALSAREYQIFVRLAKGVTQKEISEELELSIKTVNTYKTRIMEKMRFCGLADIVAYAVRNDIV